jgi:hypothetical protein
MATTVIGSTLFDGNGDKKKIISILNKYGKDMMISIFDYKQESGKRMKKKDYLKSRKNCK